ncbi:CsoS2 family carboxysome shell protein [Thiomonas sp.]|uniref:CsoS2 family carboxysome shell protein n=1 Tax=Thiomonas sp. TaxID=2047785 RepID=UPI002614E11F|nr:CsoS2 family carboxysome shell protein [Thiomonas sp.]
MTIAAPGHATATLSGRELALQRRQAMARHGKSGAKAVTASVTRTAAAVQPATASALRDAAASMPASLTAAVAQPTAPAAVAVTVSAARARRQAMATLGKAALQTTGASRPSAHQRPQPAAVIPAAVTAGVAAASASTTPAGCGCGCGGTCGCSEPAPANAASPAPRQDAAALRPAAAPAEQPTGRALAKMRRAALCQDGKAGLKRVAQATRIAAALPGQDWQTAMIKGATGRQVAMQRRLVQSLAGRVGQTASAASRPSARVRARDVTAAPPKVEQGHTLSGQAVTGTQVERSAKVTGNEPGSCRVITGTEYIGSEQFQSLCGSRPAPAAPKVAVGSTLREQRITGTALGRSTKTTGDEPGACRAVTGTEYLGLERFEQFCSTRPAAPPEKVLAARTDKGKTVTGTLVDRPRAITGGEAGADRVITGTRYGRAEPDNAPDKVVLTHTAAGKPITGTAVGRSAQQTGDEAGSCRAITGTEYLAAEQFRDLCRTTPPAVPRKVSVMSTRDAQTVSGTAVDRSAKVTGNEVGSCRAITGSQYYTTADFAALCPSPAPKKVAGMQTAGGRMVTGSEVAPSPKSSGDESFGCKPVTGTDYIGTRQLAAVCPPEAVPQVEPVNKVVVDTTLRGQTVSGSLPGRTAPVTGAEAGVCAPVSGTPYAGMGEYTAHCPAPSIEAQAARVRDSAVIPATVVTGDRPGAGGSRVTGDERGACEPVSGTPYLGPDNMPAQCAVSNRFVSLPRQAPQTARPSAPGDFSIQSPARQARERLQQTITGSGLGGARITGPINKADGLITGTPEFRHGQPLRREPAADAPALPPAARRLSGEGSQQGRRISGDAWDGNSRVTGTEGSSSLVRNPSLRGQPRGAGVNALTFRDIERPQVPDAPITGSAGNTRRGATVTVSGGARG